MALDNTVLAAFGRMYNRLVEERGDDVNFKARSMASCGQGDPTKNENFRGAKDFEADAPGPVRRVGHAKPGTTWRTCRPAEEEGNVMG